MPRKLSLVVLAAALALCGWAASAEAQKPPPPPPPPPSEPAEPQAGTVEGVATPPADPGEVRVRAESYEQVAKGHIEARGLVDLNLAGMRIQADKADIFEVTHPDGKQGHARRRRGQRRVHPRRRASRRARRSRWTDTGHGFLTNAVGYIEPGVFVEGRRVERVDDKTYRVEGGRFTSCSQPNPRWGFQPTRPRSRSTTRSRPRTSVFKVKGDPDLLHALPGLPDQPRRALDGFLFPHFGYSSTRGFNIGTGFFWAMGRSADQTFYADYYSKLGYGFGHELRYVLQSPSRGTFRTYVFDVKGAEELDYDLDWNALQILPGKVKAALNVRQYSNLLFQQRYQDDFNLATSRTQRWRLDREGPEAGGALRLRRHDEHLLRHRLHQRQRPPARPRAAALPAPDRLGQGAWSGSTPPPSGSSKGDEANSRLLGALRRGALPLAALLPELPQFTPRRATATRATARATARSTRTGTSTRSSARRSTAVLRDAGGDARADVRAGVGHPRLRTPRLQARDRPRGRPGPTASRVDDFNSIPSSTATTTSSGPTRSTTRWCSASSPSGRGAVGKPVPFEFLTWRAEPDLLRADHRRPEQVRPQLLVGPRSGPASSPSTSRRSSRG